MVDDCTIGRFTVKSGKLIICDPGYDDEIVGSAGITPVSNGEWVADAIVCSDSVSDHRPRIAVITVARDVFTDRITGWTRGHVALGISRQMCIISENVDADDYDRFYDDVCKIVHMHEQPQAVIVAGGGVVCSSGRRDGCYHVYVHKDHEDCIDAVELRFFDETDDDVNEAC